MSRASNFNGEMPVGFVTSDILCANKRYKQLGVGTMLKRSDYQELSTLYPHSQTALSVKPYTAQSQILHPQFDLSTKIAFCNGEFFAYGSNNVPVAITKDFLTFEYVNLPYSATAYVPYILKYVNNLYIMICNNGKTYNSTDGRNWVEGNTLTASIYAYNYNVFATNGTTSVCLSNYPTASNVGAYTLDGKTWTNMTMPVAAIWGGIAYGDGVFIAVMNNSTAGTVAYKSTDGITWTAITVPSNKYCSIVYSAGKFTLLVTASAYTYYSTNGGSTWTAKTISFSGVATLYQMITIPGYYIFADNANKAYLVDSATYVVYSTTNVTSGNNVPDTLLYGNGIVAFKGVSLGGTLTLGAFPFLEPDYIPLVGATTNFIRVE